LGGPLSKLRATPPFSINFRCQIENQVSYYRLPFHQSLVAIGSVVSDKKIMPDTILEGDHPTFLEENHPMTVSSKFSFY
jgi:hypothetical protein